MYLGVDGMSIYLFISLIAWMALGFVAFAFFDALGLVDEKELPSYGLDPDEERFLHMMAYLFLWPHAAWKAWKGSETYSDS
jgi:hypothetical protein